jgi:hemoglobin-like flavoprotein
MTSEQVKLVQDSFSKVAPIADQAAVIFYERLFEVAPSVKAMFPADMTEQRKKLMATLSVVVNGLSLLWTLEKGLGEAWTAEVAAAWTAAYATLSNFMIAQAYGKVQAAE